MRDEECSEHWGVGSVRCDIRSVGGGGGVTQNYQLSYSRSKLSWSNDSVTVQFYLDYTL